MQTPEDKKRRAELRHQEQAAEEAISFESAGEYFAAFQRVAELFHCSGALPDETQRFINERITELQTQPDRVSSIVQGYTRDHDWLVHLLNVGTQFDDDEMLMIVLRRNGIEMGNEVLTQAGLASGIETARVDELLDESLRVASNRLAFQRARTRAVRNCGMPLKVKWAFGRPGV
jgi:hypothetical protein